MKKFLALLMAMLMALSLVACGGGDSTPTGDDASADSPRVLKLGTTVNEEDSFHVAATKFAELVESRTNGAYKIEIYPNGSLGDEPAMLESMQIGTLDAAIVTSGPFVNFCSDMGVLDMPFLFASNEEAYRSWTVTSVRSCWASWRAPI